MEGQGGPITAESLRRDLESLGVAEGMILVVHSSLSAIGWVSGGAQAVVLALQAALGPAGTLVVPTHSTSLSEPSYWRNPPLPDESWLPIVRESMPAYDPYLTPTRQMGAVVEAFLLQRDVCRSAHPQYSFAARGSRAVEITTGHELGTASVMARSRPSTSSTARSCSSACLTRTRRRCTSPSTAPVRLPTDSRGRPCSWRGAANGSPSRTSEATPTCSTISAATSPGIRASSVSGRSAAPRPGSCLSEPSSTTGWSGSGCADDPSRPNRTSYPRESGNGD